MKTSFSILAAIVGLLVIAPTANCRAQDQAAAAPVPGQQAQPADPIKQIPHTLKSLEEAKAGKYGKLKQHDRRRLEAADRDIQTLMQRNPDLSTLGDADRVRLINAQETIIGIVSGMKRSELVCTYKEGTGTRFRTKHCMSRDMADATRRAAREATNTAQRDLCVPGETSSCK